MSDRNLKAQNGTARTARGLILRGAALFTLAGVTLTGFAAPAAAYVVVTADNRVYDISTKPEIRGDLIIFDLDGKPVSLRVYEVNLTKTNELNYMLDSGAGASQLTAQLRTLKPAIPTDERIIASSRLHQYLEEQAQTEYRVRLEGEPEGSPSFGDNAGRESRPASRKSSANRGREFEGQAREALDEADRTVRSRRETRPAESAPPAARASRSGDSDKAAEIDSDIAAEQAYLKKLTSGEEVVPDLERAIDASMDKIKRLQKRRDKLGGSSSSASDASSGSEAASTYTPTGKYPAGSREAKWEQEIVELQGKVTRLQGQKAGAEGSEREMIDESIGEAQYKIDKLQKKLDGR
jgi:hypothetical protein